jgi:TolA-binding protein
MYYLAGYLFHSGKFDEFMDTHLDYKYAPAVEYYAGYGSMLLSKLGQANYRFGRIVKNYPDSKYAPISAYLIGKICEDNDLPGEAITAYQKVIDVYPDSESAEKAGKRIAIIKK